MERMTVHEDLQEAWELFQSHGEILNEWEGNFLTDNFKRFEQYQDRTKFSDKQASTIDKILEKLRKRA
jgi:hypothetical protein